MNTKPEAWVRLDEFRHWRHERKKAIAERMWREAACPPNKDLDFWLKAEKELPLSQGMANVLGCGYGADDPYFQRECEDYKARYG